MRIVVTDDLQRSRLTTFFRLFLAIPHLIILGVWSLVSVVMAVINWFSILFSGHTVGGDLQERYIRYFVHVEAYINLAADRWPPFAGDRGYAVELEVSEQYRQDRLKTGFRAVLAIPALFLASALGGSGVQFGGGGGRYALGVIAAGAVLGWFAILARGRMPQGLRDLIVYGIGYAAQTAAYFLLLTDRYPNSDPLVIAYPQPPPEAPVRIASGDDLRRSRLTVFFRLLLTLPHLVWLVLWGLAAFFAAIASWFATLFGGRSPLALHDFLAAYIRYSTHVFAYFNLVANPFPGFTGAPGAYPIELTIAAPEPQNRWKTGFRLVLAFPALLINSALGSALGFVALYGWFTGLFRAEMPAGLQRLGVFALRYNAQTMAYVLLLTDRYPYSGPSQELLPLPEALPAAA